MKWIDSHCHLDFAAFDEDRDEVLLRARAVGVERAILAATEPAAWEKMGALRAQSPMLDVTVGIHPMWLLNLSRDAVAEGLAAMSECAMRLGACAIGEFGFDGEVAKKGVSFEEQARVVGAQIEIANRAHLPVILHIYRAHEFALAELEKAKPFAYGGVVHSYSGAAEFVPRYVALNLHLSFAGAITRPNARRPLAALRAVPRDRLLIETDSPDQAPTGSLLARNEPAELLRTAEVMARELAIPLEELAALTTQNAEKVFGTS